ncbi:MAG TPA: hypothetical protein VM491_05470 [Burkholderiaceae bacterium]|jgi:hypothetical protein|nr:hypothetical protein [Burkholderiaceae bacterium]
MHTRFVLPLISAAAAVVLAACASAPPLASYTALAAIGPTTTPRDLKPVYEVTWNWPRRTQAVIETIIERYGAPQRISPVALVWEGNGPWKRTLIYNDSPALRRPPGVEPLTRSPKDVLQQFIEYRAPASDFGKIVMFDDCAVMSRPASFEIEARCDNEESNLLMVNLAHSVIAGERGFEEARAAYAEGIAQIAAGKVPRQAREIDFSPTKGIAEATPIRY